MQKINFQVYLILVEIELNPLAFFSHENPKWEVKVGKWKKSTSSRLKKWIVVLCAMQLGRKIDKLFMVNIFITGVKVKSKTLMLS